MQIWRNLHEWHCFVCVHLHPRLDRKRLPDAHQQLRVQPVCQRCNVRQRSRLVLVHMCARLRRNTLSDAVRQLCLHAVCQRRNLLQRTQFVRVQLPEHVHRHDVCDALPAGVREFGSHRTYRCSRFGGWRVCHRLCYLLLHVLLQEASHIDALGGQKERRRYRQRAADGRCRIAGWHNIQYDAAHVMKRGRVAPEQVVCVAALCVVARVVVSPLQRVSLLFTPHFLFTPQ